MKKLFFSMLIVITPFLNSQDIEFDNLKLTREQIEAAIEIYNTEINQCETSCSQDRHLSGKKLLSMYIHRGDLNFAKKNYREALKDYQKTISYIEDHNLCEPSDFLEGICGCLFCYQCLEEDESAKQVFDKLVYQVALLQDTIEDIDWFRNSPVYPIYKKNHQSRERKQLVSLPEMTPQEYCEFQCAGYAVAASSACLKVPNLAIAAICGGCIWGLQQLCSRCCKGDGFWENCVRPLRRLFHDPEHPNNPAPHPYE